MSNTYSKFVMSKPTSATLNGKVISIFHQSPIQKTEAAWKRAEAHIQLSTKKLEYGICVWVDLSIERHGARVVKIPSDHTGVSDEIDDQKLEPVGTLLKKGKRWYVETDLNTIEIMRREQEVQKMKEGRLSIGEFGHDYAAYAKELSQQDMKAGKMITRGHGI